MEKEEKKNTWVGKHVLKYWWICPLSGFVIKANEHNMQKRPKTSVLSEDFLIKAF